MENIETLIEKIEKIHPLPGLNKELLNVQSYNRNRMSEPGPGVSSVGADGLEHRNIVAPE